MVFRRLTLILFVLLLVVPGVAVADHSWNGFHWPSDHLFPVVYDSGYDAGETEAMVDTWANLGTPFRPTFSPGNSGDVEVSTGFSPWWLGMAQVWVDEAGHITKGRVKMNVRLLASYGAAAERHVLCQELGHIWGLDHNRDGVQGGMPDDSCMNDQPSNTWYQAPNQHDAEQLGLIYSHDDGASGGGSEEGGKGGPDCNKNPNAKKCRDGVGHWVTIHVFPVPSDQ